MRLSPRFLLGLGLLSVGCHAAASNSLIGTWTTSDHGCASKYIFMENTMSFVDPGLPGLVPPSSGTVRVAYSANQQTILVENTSTGVTDSWILSDAKHAISGATSQCHYFKQ